MRIRAKKIREQLSLISDEELMLWADSLFHGGFETPREHIERKASDYMKDEAPF